MGDLIFSLPCNIARYAYSLISLPAVHALQETFWQPMIIPRLIESTDTGTIVVESKTV